MVTRAQGYAASVPRTLLCDLLGIEHPILQVGFGPGATPELVAAVSNAGGLGVLSGSGRDLRKLERWIARVRELTERPFGLNLILAAPKEEQFRIGLAEGVRVFVLFWGDPRPFVDRAHARGAKVIYQAGSVAEAVDAKAAGVDAVIAQGYEAGGHVRGRATLATLVPAVVDAVRPLPVIASGGIADGRGVAAALRLGATGVSLGTRFVASTEADVGTEYRRRIVESTAEDTVYAEDLFHVGWPDAPHRVIRNGVVREWEEAGRPPTGTKPREGEIVGTVPGPDGPVEVPRYAAGMLTTAGSTVPVDEAPLWAGQSVALIHEVKPAGDIVRDLVREADALL